MVVTADLDYPRLLVLSRADKPGLILFRGGQYTDQQVTERLDRVLETIPAAELPSSLVVVEAWRIGRRRLPIR